MPPFLAGRDRDLERFETLLARLEAGEHGRSVVYSGLRGVGKTVLLLELEKLAVTRGWDCTGVVEIGGVRVEDMVVVTDAGATNLNHLQEGLDWK